MQTAFITILFLICICVMAWLTVNLSDFISHKKMKKISEPLKADPSALNEWAGLIIPDEVRDIHFQISQKIKENVKLLPAQNNDIELRETITLNPRAYSAIDWVNQDYLPLAEVNDGDLLLIKLRPVYGEIYVYFHDGDEFVKLYSSVSEMNAAISKISGS